MTRHIFPYKKIIALGLFALACHAPIAQAMDNGGSWWKSWKAVAAVGAVVAAAGTAAYAAYNYAHKYWKRFQIIAPDTSYAVFEMETQVGRKQFLILQEALERLEEVLNAFYNQTNTQQANDGMDYSQRTKSDRIRSFVKLWPVTFKRLKAVRWLISKTVNPYEAPLELKQLGWELQHFEQRFQRHTHQAYMMKSHAKNVMEKASEYAKKLSLMATEQKQEAIQYIQKARTKVMDANEKISMQISQAAECINSAKPIADNIDEATRINEARETIKRLNQELRDLEDEVARDMELLRQLNTEISTILQQIGREIELQEPCNRT